MQYLLMASLFIVIGMAKDKRLLLTDPNVLYDQVVSLQNEVQKLKSLQTEFEQFRTQLQSITVNGMSSSYIRWGRHGCTNNAIRVYSGFAAGHLVSETGSGANFLCLPEDPLWGNYSDAVDDWSGRIYGAEYEGDRFDAYHLHNHDVPCAVCQIPRSHNIMIPGRNRCYTGWKLEYTGYLMSNSHQHPGESEYICVDGNPDVVPNSISDSNGAVLYSVEAMCASLACPPYVNGRELTCVVCSK